MTLRVYNTLSRTKEPFEPLVDGRVSMYLCGPTVYKPAHIGHLVGPVIFDTIKRYLTYRGYDVQWVINITDVDDKLINKAAERGVTMQSLAEEMTADYFDNLAAMQVDQVDQFPKATDYIDAMLDMIGKLVDDGHAYPLDGDVYFAVESDDDYGKLSGRDPEQMLAGTRAETNVGKRHPADFALWKSARDGEPSWPSDWGPGRPGWHIECSAMSAAILGERIDIHGGGLDLMFPHHENELAQSSCAHDAPMVKYWMHNGLMRAGSKGKVGGKSDRADAADDSADDKTATSGKISRSKGDGGLGETIRRHTGERIRFFLLRTHYRSTIVYGEDGLEEAGTSLQTFYRLFDRFAEITGTAFHDLATLPDRGSIDRSDAIVGSSAAAFLAAMDDDFNTGSAVSQLFDMAKSINRHCDAGGLNAGADPSSPPVQQLVASAVILRTLAGLLGLFARPVATPDADGGGEAELLDDVVRLLIDLRREARERKDYATGDAIRDRLAAVGVTLTDKKEGTTWERA